VKLRRKILLGVGAFVAVSITALAIAISYDAPCPGAPPPAAGEGSMRALVQGCYGKPSDALRVARVARPVAGDTQVLIRVHAASVNPVEWHFTTGKPYVVRLFRGFGAPNGNRVGYDFAGTVQAVGAKVTRFKVGDEVFGGVPGALAELVVADENSELTLKPATMSFEQAAAIPVAAVTALQALRTHGRLAAGERVLINGGSGGVGTYAVQIAKHYGAHVTAVCSARNVELVRALGADEVIDYTSTDFTRATARYDLLIDNVGNHGIRDRARVMKSDGIIVGIGGPKDDPWLGPLLLGLKRKVMNGFVDPEIVGFIARVNREDLELLAGLAREGALRSVIDRRFALEDTPTALEYIGSRRARGKVLINLESTGG
jgi:NADPH:quinone reductase-like Zn-dependent oxidoreductase